MHFLAGEWGGQDIDSAGKPDATWHTAFINYIQSIGATDQFYWCLNPTSSDTGGLLADDWATPVTYKLALLQQVLPRPGQVITTNGIPTALSPGANQPVINFATGMLSLFHLADPSDLDLQPVSAILTSCTWWQYR